MSTMPLSSEDLTQHIGRPAVSTDVVTPGPAPLAMSAQAEFA